MVMMFVDGLWTSRMTLHIHRDGTPIPKEMQDEYIKLELSATQMKAIAAILGLGYRNGELLCYKDEDVHNNIMRNDGFGIRSEYYSLTCDAKAARRTLRISESFAESSAAKHVSIVKNEEGYFDFVSNNVDEDADNQ